MEMNTGRAAEGSQLEESVNSIVQRLDEAFHATYITHHVVWFQE